MQCVFSGEATDSEEHVVPRWLQRRFSLAANARAHEKMNSRWSAVVSGLILLSSMMLLVNMHRYLFPHRHRPTVQGALRDKAAQRL